MLLLETLVVFRSLPFAMVVAGVILLGIASAVTARPSARVDTAPTISEVSLFAPFFAASIAFLDQARRVEPEEVRLAAAIGHGAAALLWSAIFAGAAFVVVRAARGRGGKRSRIVEALSLAGLLLIVAAFAVTTWVARPWFGEISLVTWALLLTVVWCAFRVYGSQRARSPIDGSLPPSSGIILSLGWAATGWGLLSTASGVHVFTPQEILVTTSSAVAITFLWSGAALIAAAWAGWRRRLDRPEDAAAGDAAGPLARSTGREDCLGSTEVPISMPRSRVRMLVLLLVMLAVVATALYLQRQLQIDACLDRGGRWDYEYGLCDDD